MTTIAVVDTETTGISARDEVIAIAVIVAAVDVKGRAEIIRAWEGLQCPSCDIHPAAAKVHGYTKAGLQGQQFDVSALRACLTGVDVVIGHNAGFDARMLRKVVPEIQQIPWRCSYRQWVWPSGMANKKLDSVCQHFGVERPEPHRAMSDARALLDALSKHSGKTERSRTYLALLLDKTPHDIEWTVERPATQARKGWSVKNLIDGALYAGVAIAILVALAKCSR